VLLFLYLFEFNYLARVVYICILYTVMQLDKSVDYAPASYIRMELRPHTLFLTVLLGRER